MSHSITLKILGLLLALFSTTLLPPALIAAIADDGELRAFLLGFALLLLVGLACWYPVRHDHRELRTRDGFLVVALFWSVLGLAGALPLMLGEQLHMSFTDAVFESMSGFTTTGASVLSGLEHLPLSVLYYRQQLNWLGGIGMVVLAIAVLPMLGIGGMQLYKAEVPGPIKDEKLTPRINDTARALWTIYLGLTVACTLAFWLAGMTLFDAIAFSFSTVSTGGFAPYDASLGHYDSALVDAIGAVFMILGAINFSLHYAAWHRQSSKPYWNDPECRFYLGFLGVMLGLLMVGLMAGGDLSFVEALRYGSFQLATFSSSTGLTTTNYSEWPTQVVVLLMFIGIVGGCAGSTAGGMKVIRVMLLNKQGWREIFRLVHPRALRPIRLGQQPISGRAITAVWGFFAVYVGMFALFMLVLVGVGVDQETSFSAVVAAINNLGVGAAGVAGGFGGLPVVAKWTLVAAMLMGRLEIFTMLVLFSPAFWRS